MTYNSVNKEKLLTTPHASTSSDNRVPTSPKTMFGSPKQVQDMRFRPFSTEGEQSKAVKFQLPGFENVTRRVNRPQLNLDAPSSVSIEELIKVSQDTVTRTEDDKKEPKRVQPASPIPLTYYEEIYRAESSANVTQFPSCFVSNATPSTQSPDTSRFHLYQTALKRSASEEVRLFSFAESIKPYSHHAPFYNPSFTSPSFTLILPLKWTLLPLPN